MASVYDIITSRIMEKLQQGVVPWQKPWSGGAPKNLLSGKLYRGVNVFLLTAQEHASPYWLTFVQAQELGGHVRRGEKGTLIVFWKRHEAEPQEEEAEEPSPSERKTLLRYYYVFN